MDDIGGALPWDALPSFVGGLDADSALAHEGRPEEAAWSTTAKTNAILADIYDALNQLNANLIAAASGKPSKRIKPYPRPRSRNDDANMKHYGSDPLPVSELEKWFEERREAKRNGRRN